MIALAFTIALGIILAPIVAALGAMALAAAVAFLYGLWVVVTAPFIFAWAGIKALGRLARLGAARTWRRISA